jgi:putative flippase GtrA
LTDVLRDRALLFQLVRYGITGGGVTIFSAAIYWLLASAAGLPEQLANVLSWVCAVSVGYVAHSRWSFKGHGSTAHPLAIRARFFAVAALGLGINALWVWLTVTVAGGPEWWPIPLMVFATPAIAFPLNRYWVFA